jgi:hypothetical protein
MTALKHNLEAERLEKRYKATRSYEHLAKLKQARTKALRAEKREKRK